MARARYIKPDFFKDEDLARISHAARLLFIGLWSIADRVGRLEDRPLRIKAEVFPYEALEVEPLLQELAAEKTYGNGAFIQRYEVSGRNYIQIANFEKHQKCHPKEPKSELPEPAAASSGRTLSSRGKFRPAGTNPPESVINPSESVINPSESVLPSPSAPGPTPVWSREAVDDWNERFGQSTAPAGRIGKALKPLVVRYSWETIRPAWQRYLAEKDGEFASPQDFAAKLTLWLDKRVGVGKGDQFVNRTKAVLSEWLKKRNLHAE